MDYWSFLHLDWISRREATGCLNSLWMNSKKQVNVGKSKTSIVLDSHRSFYECYQTCRDDPSTDGASKQLEVFYQGTLANCFCQISGRQQEVVHDNAINVIAQSTSQDSVRVFLRWLMLCNAYKSFWHSKVYAREPRYCNT